MEEKWKKKIGDGIETFMTTGDPGIGFDHTATFVRGDEAISTRAWSNQQLTRENLEKVFADFISTIGK
jgi:hypothetical protein